MDEKEYYKKKYDSSIKAIGEILSYVIVGILLAAFAWEFFYEMLSGGDNSVNKLVQIQSVLPFIPMPYGIKKTWHSCLILRAGSVEMWFLWFFYMVIKLAIALMYGMFAIPILLIGNILSAVDYRHKMNRAAQTVSFNNISYMQNENNIQSDGAYYNQNPYYEQTAYNYQNPYYDRNTYNYQGTYYNQNAYNDHYYSSESQNAGANGYEGRN